MKTPTPLVALVVSLLLALACATASAQEVQELTPLQPVNPPSRGTFFRLSEGNAARPYPFDVGWGIFFVYEWRPGVFLVDDTDWTLTTDKGGATTMSEPTPPPYPCTECPTNSEGGGPTAWGENFSYAGSNVLWLEIINLTNGTGKVVLHRPTGDGFDYDLITKTNIDPAVAWSWLTNLNYSASNFVSTITNTAQRFFYAKRISDTDGDSQRDFWEWGGSPPGGVLIDDDDDNDGIPDSIEVVSGSATNDPASLPPPSLYVSPYGPANGADGSLDLPFRDIQTALNAATNFSVVLVKAGTYSGASNRNLSFGGKKLVLISEKGWEETTIDCGGSNRAFTFNSTNEDYHAQVIGFSVVNTGTNSGLVRAVSCTDTSAPTFINCLFAGHTNGVAAVTNARPVFLNCRFLGNAAQVGAVLSARGSDALVRMAHCTYNDNARLNASFGQLHAESAAVVMLKNCIVWSSNTNGPEMDASGATATAEFCNVRGGYPGTGNINVDPQFDDSYLTLPNSTVLYTRRLTSTSPCIDQAGVGSFPGWALFTVWDMDNEARLDHRDFANPYSSSDMGADEYVYRLQFPVVNGHSEVDEASGVAFLGTNTIGPVIAIVDDEDRLSFHTYQLNSNATAIVSAFTNPLGEGAGNDEVHDLEGLAYDRSTNRFYFVTSQTKRNRYRDVDSSPPITEPVVDPPSNDYDRRRTKVIRVQGTPNLTNAIARYFYASETNVVPTSVGYDPTNGLAAYLRLALSNNPALRDKTVTNKVLMARNTVNKFGTPKNGVSYPNGVALPYSSGGPGTSAGTSLGEISGTTGLFTNSGVTSNTWYFYKVWAIDANTNYTAGIVASNRTDGVPKLFVNEFMASPAAGNDWIEFFNPAFVPVNMGGLQVADANQEFYRIPAGTNIAARGFLRFYAVAGQSNGSFLPFGLGASGDRISLISADGFTRIDDYRFGNQDQGISEGRAWEAGPFGFAGIGQIAEGAKYFPGSGIPPSEQAANHPDKFKFFRVTPDVRGTTNYLEWGDLGALPAVWRYSPKQHDFHAMNVEDIAFRSTNEMVLGLRAPLSNRTNGNAYYVLVTNVLTFAGSSSGWSNLPSGIAGVFEMNLGGLGIRSIKWCPNGLTNSSGQAVQRYLILAGNANGGPLQRESLKQKFALYSWTGSANSAPTKLIDDLNGYAVRPEGIDIMRVDGEWRLLFVEDRFLALGYGTRNAIHWPVTMIGAVP